MMHTSSEERSPRVMVIYWEIRHEATESLQQINGLLISADMIFGINIKMRNRYLSHSGFHRRDVWGIAQQICGYVRNSRSQYL